LRVCSVLECAISFRRAHGPPLNTSADLFARYLDLTPLRGRRRGRVLCRFHEERTPSLSVDLARGLFHCFSCGAGGGLRKFAELVGEQPSRTIRRRESHLQEARLRAAQQARREGERTAAWAPWYEAADFIRRRRELVDQVRRLVTALGAEDWPALELAAQVEREALDVEAELDDILASGRVA